MTWQCLGHCKAKLHILSGGGGLLKWSPYHDMVKALTACAPGSRWLEMFCWHFLFKRNANGFIFVVKHSKSELIFLDSWSAMVFTAPGMWAAVIMLYAPLPNLNNNIVQQSGRCPFD